MAPRAALATPGTPEAQQRALDILRFKLDILWSILDAVEKACPL
ncbi:pyrroloquinoline quinone (PQQ) biosynthesis protein C [Paraburkholderia sp. MM5496-R1]